MPIRISCQCGQQLAVKDEFIGKRVKCPKCGGPLLIAQPKAVPSRSGSPASKGVISDLLDDVGMRAGVNRCPGCGAEISEKAVLCVMCGFDLRKGHRLRTRIGSATELEQEDLGDLPVHDVPALNAAERQIARDKIQQKSLSQGAPWWMILLAFLGVVGFAIGMVSAPQEQVVGNSGLALMVCGSLLLFFYTLRLVIAAFRESVLQGLLVVLFPPYVLYFIVSRWDRVAVMAIFQLVGAALIWAGYIMVFVLGPIFQRMAADKTTYLRPHWEHRPVVMLTCESASRI